MTRADRPPTLRCPSAQPGMKGAEVFGVVGGDVTAPRVEYLLEPVPVAEVEDLRDGRVGGLPAGETLRITARCERRGCVHFGGGRCGLGERLATTVPPVVSRLPPCAIRPTCRWFAEQGGEVCLRCPQVVTVDFARPGNESVEAAARPRPIAP